MVSGNKYYPIVTADEARRSSVSVSAIKHLFPGSEVKPTPGVNMMESSIDEDDYDLQSSPTGQKEGLRDGDSEERTHLHHSSSRESVKDENSSRRGSSSSNKTGSVNLNWVDKRARASPKCREDSMKRHAAHSMSLDHDAETAFADVEDCEGDVDQSANLRNNLERRSSRSNQTSSSFLQVPHTYGDPKFVRSKSKSLREKAKSVSPVDLHHPKSRKRMSLDKVISTDCQYCLAENINSSQNYSQSQFKDPQKFCDFCITEETSPNNEKLTNDQGTQYLRHYKEGSKMFKNTFVIQSNKPHTQKEVGMVRINSNSGQSLADSSNERRRSSGKLFDNPNLQASRTANPDRNRTSCSPTYKKYHRASPSNSIGGGTSHSPKNYLLDPNANVRRTRSTRERRRSRNYVQDDEQKQSTDISPRGGSFRDKRTSRGSKLSPRLTSFEDFQNFSLLMAGHKVEIPSWKQHQNVCNESQDADVSS